MKGKFNFALLIISFLLIFGCVNKKKENLFINEEEIPGFLEKGLLKDLSLKGHVFFDDTVGLRRLNIPVTYNYTHKYWEYVVGYTTCYVLRTNGFLNNNIDSSFYVSIIYDLHNQNPAAIFHFYTKEKFNIFRLLPRYYLYCQYVISKMTPSDFQAYDWAMETKFKETGNVLFDRPFSEFFENLSGDDDLSKDERYVLEELLNWTKSRGDLEKPDHFEYFLHSFDSVSIECNECN